MNRTRSRAKKAKNTKKKATKSKKTLQASKSQHSTGGPLPERGRRVLPKYSPQIGLPPNEKLRKFADEIFGDMQVPHGKHDDK
jgi:hypothetical protein